MGSWDREGGGEAEGKELSARGNAERARPVHRDRCANAASPTTGVVRGPWGSCGGSAPPSQPVRLLTSPSLSLPTPQGDGGVWKSRNRFL